MDNSILFKLVLIILLLQLNNNHQSLVYCKVFDLPKSSDNNLLSGNLYNINIKLAFYNLFNCSFVLNDTNSSLFFKLVFKSICLFEEL